MIRRDHPAVRAMMEESDYPEHVQREFDAYMAQQTIAYGYDLTQRALRQPLYNYPFEELQLEEPAMPAWHDLALVAVGAVIVAAVLWSWLS